MCGPCHVPIPEAELTAPEHVAWPRVFPETMSLPPHTSEPVPVRRGFSFPDLCPPHFLAFFFFLGDYLKKQAPQGKKCLFLFFWVSPSHPVRSLSAVGFVLFFAESVPFAGSALVFVPPSTVSRNPSGCTASICLVRVVVL